MLLIISISGAVENYIEVQGSNYRCLACEKTFTHSHSARRHVREVHTKSENNSEQFYCDICQIGYTNRRSFDNHMRLKHNLYKQGRFMN